jgi:hypothetical protein
MQGGERVVTLLGYFRHNRGNPNPHSSTTHLTSCTMYTVCTLEIMGGMGGSYKFLIQYLNPIQVPEVNNIIAFFLLLSLESAPPPPPSCYTQRETKRQEGLVTILLCLLPKGGGGVCIVKGSRQ